MKIALGNRKSVLALIAFVGIPITLAIAYSAITIYSSVLLNTSAPGTPRFVQTVPLLPTPVPPDRKPVEPNGLQPRPSSVTPRPISKTTDLTKGLANTEKHVFIIRRANGTYEEILIPNSFNGNLAGLRQLMGLSPQDVIVTDYSLVPSHSTPPMPTFVPSSAASITPRPATPAQKPYP